MAKLTCTFSQNTVAPSSPLSSPPVTPTKPSQSQEAQPNCPLLPLLSPPASQAALAPETVPVTLQKKHQDAQPDLSSPLSPTSSPAASQAFQVPEAAPSTTHLWVLLRMERTQVVIQRPFIEAELKSHIYDGGRHFADNTFCSHVSQDSITKVLNDANLYCENQWVGIPEAVDKECELPARAREGGTHLLGSQELCHPSISYIEGIDNTKLKSSPDFMVQGHKLSAFPPMESTNTGDYIPGGDKKKKFPYKSCTALVDIKTEKDALESNFMNHLVQLTVYTRIKIQYNLTSAKPLFWWCAICGQGTQCHAVTSPDGEKHLVKEAWRLKDRTPEWQFLEEAKGLAGVGQMITHEETKYTTAKYRGIDMSSFVDEPNPAFHDRIFSQTTLQAYGEPIDRFETWLQLLYAFRDAIAGHQNLWNRKILHRDISINNILLGNEGAEPGNCGLLIDLDVGIWMDCITSLAGADFHTGTRAFQSVMVLRSALFGTRSATHDYLDDLESFFYILFWICCTYEKAKWPCRGALPPALTKWEDDNPQFSSNAKFMTLSVSFDKDTPISTYFSDIFLDLFNSLRQFLKGQVDKKLHLWNAPQGSLMALMPQSELHYAEVLRYIDVAIKAVEALPEETTLQPLTTPEKRTSTGPPDDSPRPKRKKTRPHKDSAGNENPFASTIPSKLSLQSTFE
ncbi:uncharacterized protein LACBIDRAFT_321149 [Laccaria bicolor S238N-H82]|uniref:Predicted protein n=1 Tax=Laccaria bicolor (strain S238N-H82 / ATCC MYA-4686) TaxID=486041 RepID=B0CNX4_LACBS|nr:uncharacterized protein LACBIDRAFT_321149 [Laccaria bicolor S238N-H82]EDR15368.1 predicted protein [Laccaria bicolor S238N-H82]|eukprot:XP_001873576.1 predicted protein [Laccaria bicolor S238N-H82]